MYLQEGHLLWKKQNMQDWMFKFYENDLDIIEIIETLWKLFRFYENRIDYIF